MYVEIVFFFFFTAVGSSTETWNQKIFSSKWDASLSWFVLQKRNSLLPTHTQFKICLAAKWSEAWGLWLMSECVLQAPAHRVYLHALVQSSRVPPHWWILQLKDGHLECWLCLLWDHEVPLRGKDTVFHLLYLNRTAAHGVTRRAWFYLVTCTITMLTTSAFSCLCYFIESVYNHRLTQTKRQTNAVALRLLYTHVCCSLNPLFPGTNELDQVAKIHDVLGTPDQSILQKFKK